MGITVFNYASPHTESTKLPESHKCPWRIWAGHRRKQKDVISGCKFVRKRRVNRYGREEGGENGQEAKFMYVKF